MQPNHPAICYDLQTVSQFYRSVALSVAMQRHTRTQWVEYRDSSVLNAIYGLMCWKVAPGSVEVVQSTAKIDATTGELHEQYLNAWLRKLMQQGPMVANHHATQMGRLRDDARGFVQEAIRDATELNREIVGETSAAIKKLALIRLGGTVGVAVIGATGAIVLTGAGAALVSGVGLAYSVTGSIIKTWEQGGTASAVAIDVGKAGADAGLGKFAEAKRIKALADQTKAQHVIRSAQGQIRKQSERLLQEGLRKRQASKATSILRGSKAQLARQQGVLARAGQMAKAASVAAKAVPLVFAAMDVWGAWTEYDETIKSL
jgi:hypothetical protein